MLRIAARERGSRHDNFQFPYFLSLSPSLFVFTFISADLAVSDFHSVLRPALYVKWLKCQPSLVKFYLSPGFGLPWFSVSLLLEPYSSCSHTRSTVHQDPLISCIYLLSILNTANEGTCIIPVVTSWHAMCPCALSYPFLRISLSLHFCLQFPVTSFVLCLNFLCCFLWSIRLHSSSSSKIYSSWLRTTVELGIKEFSRHLFL